MKKIFILDSNFVIANLIKKWLMSCWSETDVVIASADEAIQHFRGCNDDPLAVVDWSESGKEFMKKLNEKKTVCPDKIVVITVFKDEVFRVIRQRHTVITKSSGMIPELLAALQKNGGYQTAPAA